MNTEDLGELESTPAFYRLTKRKTVKSELSQSIVDAATKVLDTLKPGLSDKAYANALGIELRNRGHVVEQDRTFDVLYEGTLVDTLMPHLLVDGTVVVEVETVVEFNATHVAQAQSRLAITGLKLAILLNFSQVCLSQRRVGHLES